MQTGGVCECLLRDAPGGPVVADPLTQRSPSL